MARSQASGSGLVDSEELSVNDTTCEYLLEPEVDKGGMSRSVLVPTELTASISSRSTA